MTKASVKIVLFLMCLNAASTVVVESGMAEDIGMKPDVGEDDKIQEVKNAAKNVEAGGGGASFLIGLTISAITTGIGVLDFLFAWSDMMKSLGIPGWITDMGTALVYAVFLFDVLSWKLRSDV